MRFHMIIFIKIVNFVFGGGGAAILYTSVLLKFMFKIFSRSVECMPLWNFHHLDKCLILNEQNSLEKNLKKTKTLCSNKCPMIYLFIIPNLSIKFNFYRCKPVDPPAPYLKCVKCCHHQCMMASNWQVHRD